MRQRALQAHQQFAALDLQMNLPQGWLLSRRNQLGRQRVKRWTAWGSGYRQRHERGRSRYLPLSLFTDPAVHHVRMQAMRQRHAAYAGTRLGAARQYFCLELFAVVTPPWAVLIQRIFHRLHDPPIVGTMPASSGSFKMGSPAAYIFAPAMCVSKARNPLPTIAHSYCPGRSAKRFCRLIATGSAYQPPRVPQSPKYEHGDQQADPYPEQFGKKPTLGHLQ